MKVLVNGGLQVSELDGWWDEAYANNTGWAIGNKNEPNSLLSQDEADATQLFDLLEKEIIPLFYHRNEGDIPEDWLMRVRNSMATLCPRFSANRSLREYIENYYLPAAARFESRAANKGEAGIAFLQTIEKLKRQWNNMQFGQMEVSSQNNQHFFSITLFHPGILPDQIKVQLYAEAKDGKVEIYEMQHTGYVSGSNDASHYKALITNNRSVADYTARVIPAFNHFAVPLECSLILWQR